MLAIPVSSPGRPGRSKLRWALVLLPLAAALTSMGRAEEPSEAGAFEALRQAGRACYRRRDYSCALRQFEAAYARRPTPSMRFNIASAQDKLGLRALALRQYQLYMAEAGAAVDPRALDHIRKRVTFLVTQVARLRLQVAPEKSRVLLNGTPVELAALPLANGRPELVLEPGTHRLDFSEPGFEPKQELLSVLAGQLLTLQVELRPAPPQSAPLVSGSQPASPPAVKTLAQAPGPPPTLARAQPPPEPVPARPSAPSGSDLPPLPPPAVGLPLTTALLATRAEFFFELTPGDVSAYVMGLEAHLRLRRRWQVGINLPLVVHGALAGSEGTFEATAFGNLTLKVALQLLGGGETSRWSLAAFSDLMLPTSSAEMQTRAMVGWRPGLALTGRLGRFSVVSDLSIDAVIREGADLDLLQASLAAAFQPLPWCAVGLAAQLGVYVEPALATPGLAFWPWISFYPWGNVSLALSGRLAANQVGKLYARGASGTFMSSLGWRF